ncbi:AMP-binding protein [Saccharomonospora sp. NB11]|uniref:AMP-binding protein n=1 Tax=Saccharomonospora sp. NB11 TaxID=1642298 RepID=UPI0018D0CA4B|nr:AMP-binding protein [Saccharomonospora sp. NB11]
MNLLSLLAGLTRHDPHAIIAIDADPDQPQHVSRAELWRHTLQLRADLATAGVGRGDGVLVLLPASSSVLEWHVATASLGAHVVCADVDSSADTLGDVLRRVRPKVVATPHLGPASTTLHEAVRHGEVHGGVVPTVAVVPAPGRTPPVDPSPYDVGAGAWLPSPPTVGMPMPEVRGDEVAVAFLPELAAHRESALTRHAHATAEALGLGEDDVVLCTTPPSSPLWLSIALAAVSTGATCLLEARPTPRTVLADVARFGVTHVATDAECAAALAALAGTRDTPTWRWLGVAGRADAPEAHAEAVRLSEQAFGLPATALYTVPELCPPVALWPSGAPERSRGHAGGRPVGSDVEFRIVHPETGAALPSGVLGEIQVRGTVVPDTWLDSPDAFSTRRTVDGWFCTGDSGSLDVEGTLRHTGRVVAASRD